MTAADLTLVVFIVDRSGSMGLHTDGSTSPTRAELTTTGIRDMVREQQAQPGRLLVSLTDFDTEGIRRVESFGDGSKTLAWSCQPRGGTPLYDAIGQTIVRTGEQLQAMPEEKRPGKVVVVIGTDGEENSSFEYTASQVRDMVAHQQDAYGWQFAYIGVELDAMAESAKIAVPMGSAMSTAGVSTVAAYNATSGSVSSFRAGGQSVAYTDEQREAVKKAGGK
jgi:Mg-chelatase subunit ChlD